jgi:cancer susceptibility candidate protein 1
MRAQHRTRDEFFHRCTNALMAVGGVLYIDLLTLPPQAKKVKHWVLRQVTPLASNVVRIPYPIPPAGADPATYRSEEEPPPLGFTFPFQSHIVLLDDPIQARAGLLPPTAY